MNLQNRLGFLLILGLTVSTALADRIELRDGKVIDPCILVDEGNRVLVWDSIKQIGGPPQRMILRSLVKTIKITRDDSWDIKPNLPDLSVTHIEMTPKLAGLHGHIDYASPWIMKPGGSKQIIETGDDGYLHPEATVKNLQFQHKIGETVTLTAHVKNLGFKSASGFKFEWTIDGKVVQKGSYSKAIKEMDEATFTYSYKWSNPKPLATFTILTDQEEISKNNNFIEDPLWGFSYIYIAHKGRIAMWHQFRSAFGTFSFEDYYRWHVDIMNRLFAASIFPSSPQGILARVRLDKIVYTDDVDKAQKERNPEGGLIMDQGGWIWTDTPEELKSGKWNPPTREWRTSTEWSLPHELGHQLGLIDWYQHDYEGTKDFVWADNGEKVAHFQNHPNAMMHWHGPNVFNEIDAAYLNMTWNKPRGHFGDHVFAIPAQNYLRIVDVNGQPVTSAKVEIFQRGVKLDPTGKAVTERGSTYYPIKMDGEFGDAMSTSPVISGQTDASGTMYLPNRPVREVVTLNGFHLKPNPFGHLNCFQPCLMMVRVTVGERVSYYFLEIYDFNVAWFRGQKDRFEITLKSPTASVSSPKAPTNVRVEKVDETHVRVSWDWPVLGDSEQTYLKRPIGYRIYRRVGPMGLNDRPWFVVGSVGPDAKSFVVDLSQYPIDVEWFNKTNRFAVSSVGDLSLESELVDVVMK